MSKKGSISRVFYAIFTIAFMIMGGISTAYYIFDNEGKRYFSRAIEKGIGKSDFYGQVDPAVLGFILVCFGIFEILTKFASKKGIIIFYCSVIWQLFIVICAFTYDIGKHDSQVLGIIICIFAVLFIFGLLFLLMNARRFSKEKKTEIK
jgi:hypothetical protein